MNVKVKDLQISGRKSRKTSLPRPFADCGVCGTNYPSNPDGCPMCALLRQKVQSSLAKTRSAEYICPNTGYAVRVSEGHITILIKEQVVQFTIAQWFKLGQAAVLLGEVLDP